jgi:hypothetical protein
VNHSTSILVIGSVIVSMGAGSSHAQAIKIVAGPEIAAASPTTLTVVAQTDVQTVAQLALWPANGDSTLATIYPSPKDRQHSFSIPRRDQPYRYRVTFASDDGTSAISPRMSTLAVHATEQSAQSAEFLTDLEIDASTGNQALIQVRSKNVPHLRASWTGSDGGTGGQTVNLLDGTQIYRFTFPGQAGTQYRVNLEAVSGTRVVAQDSDRVTIRQRIVPTSLTVGASPSTVSSEMRRIVWRVPFQPIQQVVSYEVALKNAAGFTRTYEGTCQSDQCSITLDGLTPGTKYAPSIRARLSSAQELTPFYAGQTLDSVATTPQPSLSSGPTLTFSPTGLQLSFETTARANSRMTATLETGRYDEQRTDVITHTYDLTRPLAFAQETAGRRKSAFSIEVREPGTNALIMNIPLTLAGVESTDQRAQALWNQNGKVKEFAEKVGPALSQILDVIF